MMETLLTTTEPDHHPNGSTDRTGLFTVANELSIFGDRLRLHILFCLARSHPMSVKAIREIVGGSQSAASYHLGLLLQAGVVTSERVGQERHYRLVPGRIREILSQLDPLITE